jgi:hypothetical protein
MGAGGSTPVPAGAEAIVRIGRNRVMIDKKTVAQKQNQYRPLQRWADDSVPTFCSLHVHERERVTTFVAEVFGKRITGKGGTDYESWAFNKIELQKAERAPRHRFFYFLLLRDEETDELESWMDAFRAGRAFTFDEVQQMIKTGKLYDNRGQWDYYTLSSVLLAELKRYPKGHPDTRVWGA